MYICRSIRNYNVHPQIELSSVIYRKMVGLEVIMLSEISLTEKDK
jgi:hypothetical protein